LKAKDGFRLAARMAKSDEAHLVVLASNVPRRLTGPRSSHFRMRDCPAKLESSMKGKVPAKNIKLNVRMRPRLPMTGRILVDRL
jgi:hypothetical protein